MNLGCTRWVLTGYFVHFLAIYLQCSSPGHHPLPPVYVTLPTAPLELEDIVVQDALRFSTPIEEQSGVRECCRMRVVEFMNDLVEIADDKRSETSLLESSSSSSPSLPGLEDQENFPPVNFENINAIPDSASCRQSSSLCCEWSMSRSYQGHS